MKKKRKFIVATSVLLCMSLYANTVAAVNVQGDGLDKTKDYNHSVEQTNVTPMTYSSWTPLNIGENLYFENKNEKVASNSDGMFVFKNATTPVTKKFNEASKTWSVIANNTLALEADLICGGLDNHIYFIHSNKLYSTTYNASQNTWSNAELLTLPSSLPSQGYHDMCYYGNSIFIRSARYIWKCSLSTNTATATNALPQYGYDVTFIPIHTKANVAGSVNAGLYLCSDSGETLKKYDGNVSWNSVQLYLSNRHQTSPTIGVHIFDRGIGTDGAFIYLIGGEFVENGIDDYGQPVNNRYACNYVDRITGEIDGSLSLDIGGFSSYLNDARMKPKVVSTPNQSVVALGGICTPGAYEAEITKFLS